MNAIILFEVVLFVAIQHVLTVVGESRKPANPCPDNFLRIHNKCYYFSHDHEPWERAKWKCQDRNSTLAAITNKNQNTALREFLRKGYVGRNPPSTANIQTDVPRWMGGQYDWKSSQWKWIYNGKVIPQNQFNDDLKDKNMAWHCLIIDPIKNYRWNATSCFDKNYYVCQTRLLGRKPQAANITANNTPNNSTEQRDSQPGFYVVDADPHSTKKKKPKRKFTCPKDYVLAGRRCYWLSRDKENWNNAYYKCQDVKGELAVFNNTKQDQRLRVKLRRLQIVSEKQWIGGYYDFKNSLWKWAASGRLLPVQPNAVTDLKWSCVLWDPSQTDRWSSESCLVPMYYMCQTVATPAEKKSKSQKRKTFRTVN